MEGSDVVVGLVLPLFEGLDAPLKTGYRLPYSGVIKVVAGGEAECYAQQYRPTSWGGGGGLEIHLRAAPRSAEAP